MYTKFAIRDALIVATAVVVWQFAAHFTAEPGPRADLIGFVIGVLIGVSSLVLHEWGHVLAGLAVGSRMAINHNLRSTYLFSYDADGNTPTQFAVMSVGGFAVTAIALFGVYAYLPDAYFATRVARGAVLLLTFLTVFLEFPLLLFTLRARKIPAAAAVKVQAATAER